MMQKKTLYKFGKELRISERARTPVKKPAQKVDMLPLVLKRLRLLLSLLLCLRLVWRWSRQRKSDV